MQEVIEKIIERLGKIGNIQFSDFTKPLITVEDAVKIVNQEAAEYNNGWIPVEKRLPENDNYILLSFENFSIPIVGRYEEDENGGAFCVGDESETCVSQDLFVNAWQPLPKPYQKGE